MSEQTLRPRVIAWMDRLDREGVNMHGFHLTVRGTLAASGTWGPFREEKPHRMYSVSKTMVGLAVGMLAEDGLLSLDDPICKFFGDWLPKSPAPALLHLTVRDMLRMATCYRNTTYREGVDECWALTFFEAAPDHEPGTVFNYDTSCSQVLAELVLRLSGRDALALLEERLFAPLGASDPKHWLRDPSGALQGGTGLCMSPRDFHKVSVCLLEGGRGLVPARYVSQMRQKQIETPLRPFPEERYGYGWQCWRTRAGWSMYGLGGQLAIFCPDRDAVLTTVADTRLDVWGVQRIYDAFFEELWPFLKDAAMAPEVFRRPLPPLPSPAAPGPEARGRWRFGENPLGIRSLALKDGVLAWENARGRCQVPLIPGQVTETAWPGVPEEPALTAASWLSPRELLLRCHAVGDAPCGFELLAVFTGDAVTLQCRRSNDPLTDPYDGSASGTRESADSP